MKVRVLSTLCLMILAGNVAYTVAQENRFDISLEGPWILYVDRHLTKWPVLIAIVPNTHSVGRWRHDAITVSSGDGYFLADYDDQNNSQVSHIYCLIFDGNCAPVGTNNLMFHDYPDSVQILSVKKPATWDWVKAVQQQSATAVILPMPDSYSSDGVWPMRFAGKFDQGHSGYGRDEQHSIGVQLHYKSGPTFFDLNVCDGAVLGKCAQASASSHTLLPNSGTLRIVMRAPITDWACDPHVRRIYPRMLDIVGQAANPQLKVIDPAHAVKDDGTGAYDEDFPVDNTNKQYQCLVHDGQWDQCDNTTNNTYCDDPPIPTPTPPTYMFWVQNLLKLRTAINALDSTNRTKYDLAQIADSIKDLAYPRISQIDAVQLLVAESYAQLKNLDSKVPFQEAFSVEKKLIDSGAPTKSGNDCKAPVMLTQ